ncbi:hypothetical protein NG895_13980 [Aeoliella sp. ICT_H6.2]|uniref:TIGR03009 domain-containing protein n=1 Tax=Aeoliella straminimaris TaxID=2954799 RepID=A0A9X2JJI2_9BACT|nr:hypothetical protein [Aeoliella straminimaris]MCO6045014.1 hypothetical protein [Aeoliella straminimaris]
MPRTPILLAIACLAATTAATAQQPTTPNPSIQQVAQQQPAVAPGGPFQLSPAQLAWVDDVLRKWEGESKNVNNFYCNFKRSRHTIAGPGDGRPAAREQGKLAYHKPDRGSFQITESLVWTPKQQPLGQPNQLPQQQQAQPVEGSYLPRKDVDGKVEPGEHWVCSGEKIFQFRRHDKELVVTPVPKEMQGKEIVNGPLPFMFGAEAEKLKKRFWMEPDMTTTRGSYVGIHAKPKFQADAAEYSDIYVVLQNVAGKPLMPVGIRVVHPNRSWDEYVFDLNEAQVNPVIAAWFSNLFQEPRTPLGWKRVEEPLRQAQQPQNAPK